jgi:hypothetical protein
MRSLSQLKVASSKRSRVRLDGKRSINLFASSKRSINADFRLDGMKFGSRTRNVLYFCCLDNTMYSTMDWVILKITIENLGLLN